MQHEARHQRPGNLRGRGECRAIGDQRLRQPAVVQERGLEESRCWNFEREQGGDGKPCRCRAGDRPCELSCPFHEPGRGCRQQRQRRERHSRRVAEHRSGRRPCLEHQHRSGERHDEADGQRILTVGPLCGNRRRCDESGERERKHRKRCEVRRQAQPGQEPLGELRRSEKSGRRRTRPHRRQRLAAGSPRPAEHEALRARCQPHERSTSEREARVRPRLASAGRAVRPAGGKCGERQCADDRGAECHVSHSESPDRERIHRERDDHAGDDRFHEERHALDFDAEEGGEPRLTDEHRARDDGLEAVAEQRDAAHREQQADVAQWDGQAREDAAGDAGTALAVYTGSLNSEVISTLPMSGRSGTS